MKTCTFFGHRQISSDLYEPLRTAIVSIIENEGVRNFYVGNQGGFDSMVLRVLRELSLVYQDMKYSVVLAYYPTEKNLGGVRPEETLFPETVAKSHPRFAIDKRNRYMIECADYVIAYASHLGGAMKHTEIALKKGKKVINLAQNAQKMYLTHVQYGSKSKKTGDFESKYARKSKF